MSGYLLGEIQRFLARHSMPESTFGRQFRKDPRFVYDLKRGRSTSYRVEQSVLQQMRDYERDLAESERDIGQA